MEREGGHHSVPCVQVGQVVFIHYLLRHRDRSSANVYFQKKKEKRELGRGGGRKDLNGRGSGDQGSTRRSSEVKERE